MRKILTFMLLVINIILLINGNSFTQTVSVRGIIISSKTKEPVSFCNILLEQAGIPVSGVTSDYNGHFFIKNIEPGSYRLKSTYVGFKSYQKEINILTDDSLTIEMQQMKQMKCCYEIIDSLKQVGYFMNSIQVDLEDIPVSAEIIISRSYGDYKYMLDSAIISYDNGKGSIISSTNNFRRKFIFSGPSFLKSVFARMNELHLFDSSFLIRRHSTCLEGGWPSGAGIFINIIFPNGKLVSNNISFNEDYYCAQVFKIRDYIVELTKSLEEVPFTETPEKSGKNTKTILPDDSGEK